MSTFTVPVVLGGGKKLFADGSASHSYKLTSRESRGTGLMIAHYERGGEVRLPTPPSPSRVKRKRRGKSA